MPDEATKEIKVKWQPRKSDKPDQIYTTGLEYCFINGENQQCHEFVYCKDFLHDAVHAFLYEKVADIYDFVYNPKSMPPLMLSRTKIALSNASDKNFVSKMDNMVDFINQCEVKLKLKKSKGILCSNPPNQYKNGVIILRGSAKWIEAPPMLSLYTLLVRIGFIHKKGNSYTQTMDTLINGSVKPYQKNDTSYLSSAKKSVDRILEEGYRKIFYSDIKRNYPKNVDIGTLHNNFGIVGFTSKAPKQWVPGWWKSKKKKITTVEAAAANPDDYYIDCEMGLTKKETAKPEIIQTEVANA